MDGSDGLAGFPSAGAADYNVGTMVRVLSIAVAISVAAASCTPRIQRKVGATIETVDLEAAFLKVHLRSGDVYVLSKWIIDEKERVLVGTGERQGPDRSPGVRGNYKIRFDEVALYETNTVGNSPVVTALAVVTGISVAISIACLTNPKACFGSCPTFYADTDEGQPLLQAEGFSDSIAPSLEKNDVDALWRSTGRGGALTVRMTNEAYETHVVKQVDLLAVPRPEGGRVLATADRLWIAPRLYEAAACEGPEGSCLAAVVAMDGAERKSVTDGEDLATREQLEVTFAVGAARMDGGVGSGAAAANGAANGGGVATGAGARAGAGREPAQLAVVIGARQSLVTTFLLYQGLAYLGTTATTWLAALERSNHPSNPIKSGGRELQRLLGGIEVQVEQGGSWQTVGEVYETGPIATDVHLVKLPAGVAADRVRLRMPQGSWRLDYVALAEISGEATPIRLAPSQIRGELSRDFGRGRTPATSFPIVTVPGDEYELTYQLPPGERYDLFLDSRGYYLEWMRKEWLGEEKPLAALRMFLSPAEALRELAPAFKKLEPQAEELFWRSRYARP